MSTLWDTRSEAPAPPAPYTDTCEVPGCSAREGGDLVLDYVGGLWRCPVHVSIYRDEEATARLWRHVAEHDVRGLARELLEVGR